MHLTAPFASQHHRNPIQANILLSDSSPGSATDEITPSASQVSMQALITLALQDHHAAQLAAAQRRSLAAQQASARARARNAFD